MSLHKLLRFPPEAGKNPAILLSQSFAVSPNLLLFVLCSLLTFLPRRVEKGVVQ